MQRQIETIEREGMGYNEMPKIDFEEEEIYEQFVESHPMYKRVVEEVINNFSPASNNDFILQIEFLKALGLAIVYSNQGDIVIRIKKSNLKRVPSPETSSRIRRTLNTHGKCLPTSEKVLIRRAKRHKALKKYFRYND